MFLKSITLEDISSLKSSTIINLTCDSCGTQIPRTVKAIRHSIKNSGATQAFCSNKCQGDMLKKTYTRNCERCDSVFETSNKEQKNCSRYCANQRVQTQETKDKIASTLKGRVVGGNRPKTPYRNLYRNTENEYCPIFTCSCQSCGFVGTYRTQRWYCSNCDDMYSANKRAKYQFTFNVYHYPDLFDLDIIDSVGWRTTLGENKNVFGISRDHKISVRDAIDNNYDPYYIKHPLNCELMKHDENQRKGTQSSLTYEELVKLVDEYDKK